MSAHNRTSLKELALLFLKLGVIAFGGPAAHIAMMEQEVVRRRQWLTHQEFLDMVGATNLIPGPNSTELAIHIGRLRAGMLGILVAGVCFITPAALIVGTLAWAYVSFGNLPNVAALLYGIKPIMTIIIVQALWKLGRAAIKTKILLAVGIGAFVLTLWHVDELVVLLIAGLATVGLRQVRSAARTRTLAVLAVPLAAPSAVATTTAITSASLFLFFLKIGAVLFGSGYVLIAFLQADLVDKFHWLTQTQLLDAVAVGQFTPGPVFTTATFIGYLLGGTSGAVAATVGIFLPAFIFVALSAPLLPRLRQSRLFSALLDGINVGSLALMLIMTIKLGSAVIVDTGTAVIAALGALSLFYCNMNPTYLILGGGILGWALKAFA